MTRTMIARYSGSCSSCGARVHRGDQIAYDRGARCIVHCPSCDGAPGDRSAAALVKAQESAYEDRMAEACGLAREGWFTR